MDASQAQKSKREHLARHRNRQGRTRRRPLTEVELRYCAMRARGVTIRQAALELGLNEGTVLQWSTRRPAIKEQIEEYKARSKEEAYKETQKEITLRNEFLDEQVIRRLQEEATTPDIVRLIDLGYKRTGAIRTQTARVGTTVSESPDASPPSGRNYIEIYESEWLRKRKAEWEKQFEEKYGKRGPM